MPRHAASIEQIPVSGPASGPYAITTGPDDALWFTLVHAGEIARLTPDGQLHRFRLDSASSGPSVITPGPDGALWFTRSQDHRIGRITLRSESRPAVMARCGSRRCTPTRSAASAPTAA